MIVTCAFSPCATRQIPRLASLTLAAVVVAARLHAGQIDTGDGSLDPRFGTGGIAATVSAARSAAVQADGKIVVAGALLARHNVDGSLDRTFGAQGTVQSAGAGLVALQPDGKILVAGTVLARYNADGSPDTGFGAGGSVPSAETATALALQDDGRILLVGNSALTRFNRDGTVDAGFGTSGSVARAGLNAVAIQSDGKIVAAGAGTPPLGFRSDFMVVRYNEDGAIDPGFGTGGLVYTDFGGRIDKANALVIQRDGKILVAGEVGDNRVNTPWDFGLARYNHDGTLDGTFGGAGRVRTIVGAFSRIKSVKLQIDGKIVAAGESQTVAGTGAFLDVAVVQYHGDGMPDDRFGIAGTVTTRMPSGGGSASDVEIQRDGRIVAVSYSNLNRYRYDSVRGPFGGTPHAIPGLIEAEDYDVGGQGFGFSDTTAGSEQGFPSYRSDDVDIKTSREGGHTIGWFAAGEYLTYTTDVVSDSLYTLQARVGSALPGRTFHIEVDGVDVTGAIAVPLLLGWDEYRTVSVVGVRLGAGRQQLRVVMGPESFMDLQWIAVVP